MSDSVQMAGRWAHRITVFAGIMLIVGGAFQALEALAAIVNDQYLVVLPNYIYAIDLTAWGLAAFGIWVLLGQGWAKIAAERTTTDDPGQRSVAIAKYPSTDAAGRDVDRSCDGGWVRRSATRTRLPSSERDRRRRRIRGPSVQRAVESPMPPPA